MYWDDAHTSSNWWFLSVEWLRWLKPMHYCYAKLPVIKKNIALTWEHLGPTFSTVIKQTLTLFCAKLCTFVLCALAMRDLFASMERSGGSFPPIMMLNVLHMCFPQFAQKNDQGVFQQQVHSSLTVSSLFWAIKYTVDIQLMSWLPIVGGCS